MKFEYEKFGVALIQRRAREEEARTGRRVTRVKLTPPEWAEFQFEMIKTHRYTADFHMPYVWNIHVPRPLEACRYDANPCDYTTHHVEVVLDRP